MAASLSRPDPSSPASVAEAGFTTTRRGFAQDEVRAFLTSVAAELSRLKERERQLEAQLEMAAKDAAPAVELDENMVTELLGEETLRVLQTARESASQIKIRAEESAAGIVREANDEANRVRQEAEVESARRRHDAASDSEAELALAKQQGREMVNEARAYRERVLADLERRTKLARQQIEDLVHGRDRLLQVFERARLVAVDVTSELQSIDGPEEIVNLSPTTGPLPIMVPAGELDRGRVTVVGDDEPAGSDAHPIATELSELVVEEHGDDVIDDGLDPVVDDTASDEATTDEAAPDDTASDEAATDEAASDEAPTDDTAIDDSETSPETPAKPARDANVVSLFGDRASTEHGDASADDARADDGSAADAGVADAGAADAGVEDAAAEDARADVVGGRPDVGGIFERLRNEAPTDTDAVAEEPAAAVPAAEAADESDEPTAFSRRDEAIVPLIVAGARKLKRVLADEQNAVLDRLRQKEPANDIETLVATLDDHVRSYTDAIAEELMDAAIAGAAEVGGRPTKKLRTSLTRRSALEPAHELIREDLVAPLRDRLDRAISDGSGDDDAITKRVRAVYREWKTQHIDDQLDDVFRYAHGGGLATSAKSGTELVWTLDPSEPTCPDCEDNSLAGPVGVGENYPTGHTAAPAHPGCRCITVPPAT